MSVNNSSDTKENRTRDLPTCSAVPLLIHQKLNISESTSENSAVKIAVPCGSFDAQTEC